MLLVVISISLLLSIFIGKQAIAIFLITIGIWLALLGYKENSKSKIFWGGFLVSISISYAIFLNIKIKWQIPVVIFITGIIVTLFVINSMKTEKIKN